MAPGSTVRLRGAATSGTSTTAPLPLLLTVTVSVEKTTFENATTVPGTSKSTVSFVMPRTDASGHQFPSIPLENRTPRTQQTHDAPIASSI